MNEYPDLAMSIAEGLGAAMAFVAMGFCMGVVWCRHIGEAVKR